MIFTVAAAAGAWAEFTGAGVAFCRLEDTFREDRKPKRLARSLGIARPYARGLVAGLWAWAVTHAPDGSLGDASPEDVADACDWQQDPLKLVRALVDAGILDESAEGLIIHGYMERAESFRRALAKRAKRNGTDAGPTRDRRGTDAGPGVEESRVEESRGDRSGVDITRDAQIGLPQTARIVTDSIWDYYRQHHPRAARKIGAKERKLCNARLHDFTAGDIKQAIDGYHRSPYHCGVNKDNQKYQSLELILRDNGHVQKGIEYATDPTVTHTMTEKTRKSVAGTEEWLRQRQEKRDAQ